MAQRHVDKAAIAATGMLTPIGAGTAQTMTSLAAGITRFRLSQVVNRKTAPMQLATVPESALATLASDQLPGRPARARRLLRLALPALHEVLAPAAAVVAVTRPRSAPPAPIPLFLAGPAGFFDADFVARLVAHAPLPLAPASTCSTGGRAATLQALANAFEALDQGAETVILGAVDSHLDLALLDDLDSEGRVLADGVLDGFCPGEAAVFLRLTLPGRADTPPRASLLHRPGFGSEPGHRGTGTPNTGAGLTAAIAGAANGTAPITACFASLNGERDGAREWGIARIRHGGLFGADSTLHHPAEYLGDTGAACGAVLIAAAATHLQQDPGTALVWCAADGPERAAVLLSRPHVES